MQKELETCIASYPEHAQQSFHHLRNLLLKTAEDLNAGTVSESLKWGEPSFAVKHGSPVRIAWKADRPDQIFLFFICQTKLVETFREIYPDTFAYDGNRAIPLTLDEPVPDRVLEHCISLALNYKKIKHLPLLGC